MDGVDGEWNSQIYCNRPPKEALGRTDLFVDCGCNWREIPTDMIESSFLKCGITNHLDGSEDHLVYETNDELVDDDTFVREMFMSDSESESEFEGFHV